MVKVSVIIPIYNVENYLNDLLSSLLNQTLEDIEIICVNDGSTDNSLNILNDFEKKDKRIKVLNQENKGAAIARNNAMKIAKGEYIQFIDADDSIPNNMLETLYNNAILNDSDIVVFKVARFNNFKTSYSYPIFKLEDDFENVDFNNVTFNHSDMKKNVLNSSFAPWTKFLKKEFLEKHDIKFQTISSYNDVLFHVKTMLKSSKISYVPQFLYYYRLDNPNSITNDPTKHLNIFKVINAVKNFLNNENYMTEYQKEFDAFKITQIIRHISFPLTEEYLRLAKEEFLEIDVSSNKLITQNDLKKYNILLKYSLDEIFLIEEEFNLIYLENKNKKLKKGNKKLNKKLKKEKKLFDELSKSKSWKITKPLRTFKNHSIKEIFLNKSNSYMHYKTNFKKMEKENKKLRKQKQRQLQKKEERIQHIQQQSQKQLQKKERLISQIQKQLQDKNQEIDNYSNFITYFNHFYELLKILMEDKDFEENVIEFTKIIIELEDIPIYISNKNELITLLNIMDDLKSLYVDYGNTELIENVSSSFDKIISKIDLFNIEISNNGYKNLEDKYSMQITIKKINKKPKISVVIPVYNSEKYIKKCLDSVINQTLGNIEIICINDGSTDNSLEILNQYAKKDERIKIFTFENKGLGASRNRGISRSNGEYVAFLDSDDWLELTFCERIYETAIKNEADIVLFNAIEEYETYKKKRTYFSKRIIPEHEDFVFDFRWTNDFILSSYFTAWSKLHRTAFLKENNIKFPNSIFEDMAFQVESYLKAKRICYNPTIFYHYRKTNPQSIMNSLTDDDCYCIFDVINQIENHLKNNNVMNIFKNRFMKFKINQLKEKFDKVSDDFKESYFKLIKDEFLNMDVSLLDLEKFPAHTSRFYIFVLNSENYIDFEKFNENITSNIKYINKEELNKKIDNFRELGVTSSKRENKIIVSLTSFPERLRDIGFCLYSLLTQNFKPDEVILWLAVEEFPNKEKDIPQNVLNLKNNGLTIKWCKNIKSYKKLIPALNEYPNDFIVTADDDLFYPKNWLENIYKEYEKYPNTIIASRLRKITFDEFNNLDKYSNWHLIEDDTKPSYLNFPTSGGGTLYYPHALSDIVTNEDLFLKLCPTGDDIWFWAMAIKNKTKIKSIKNPIGDLCYINPTRELRLLNEKTLWNINKNGTNDIQINNILSHFSELLDILIND